jgi:trehalose 6-phosphate synthase
MYDAQKRQNYGVSDFNVEQQSSAFEDRQLVVVSNRQPYRHTTAEYGTTAVDRPTGGLTASLDPAMQHIGGTWVAWGDGDADRDVVDDDHYVSVPPEDPSYRIRRVWLSDEQVQGYYYGFSNRVLWPLCHSSLATIRSQESYWEQYQQTNEQFADVVSEEAAEDAVIWLQDYHFGLAARDIRAELGTTSLLVQFWHIPWPAPGLYDACPHGRELLDGLLANDVLAFHVGRYCQNFLECVDAEFDDVSINWRTGTVSYRGSETRVKSIPMGVPFDRIEEMAREFTESEYEEFKTAREIDPDTRVAVGVDRLDYSKGIPERLRALELFWERHPDWRGSVTHVLNVSDSRSEIPAYERLQKRVSDGISRINDRFGTDDWRPVIEIKKHLSQRELYGLYRHADVGLVTPIRDGLNLVAAEYAAAQIDTEGVLVLSDQSGVHDVRGNSALSVSPFDPGQIAEQFENALTMAEDERTSRMESIRQSAAENDLETWIQKNAAVVSKTVSEREIPSTST